VISDSPGYQHAESPARGDIPRRPGTPLCYANRSSDTRPSWGSGFAIEHWQSPITWSPKRKAGARHKLSVVGNPSEIVSFIVHVSCSMTFEPANRLGLGSIVRLAHDQDEPMDGSVVVFEVDQRVTVNYGGWFEIWEAGDLSYDPQKGVWRPIKPGMITDTI
jgi:hypothetical protein